MSKSQVSISRFIKGLVVGLVIGIAVFWSYSLIQDRVDLSTSDAFGDLSSCISDCALSYNGAVRKCNRGLNPKNYVGCKERAQEKYDRCKQGCIDKYAELEE